MNLLTIVILGLAGTLLATPLVRRLARSLDIVDRPDGHRKLHRRETPLGGGVAVLAGFALAVAGMLLVANPWLPELRDNLRYIAGMLAAACILCGIGLLDDRFEIRGRQKLAGQALAAAILIASGLSIHKLHLFGWDVELGLLAIPFTMFWLLGAINALNLVDGADGLATSVGIILALAIACMALLTGHTTDALLALALAGSLAGFLCYNFPPASIFLGDGGSMLIGLVLGGLALHGSLKGPATVALAAPTAIWAIPILDVGMAILRRKLTGRSIYVTDRGHLHHCLARRGYSGRKTVAVVGLLCAVTATGALVSLTLRNEWLALATVTVVAALMVVFRFFGHGECMLLLRRGKSLASSLLPGRSPTRTSPPRQLRSHFQGNREWDSLWNSVTDFAERFDLDSVQLNVHLPHLHEEFYAQWDRPSSENRNRLWHTHIPLLASEIAVGHLEISGQCRDGSACLWMGELIAGLKPVESQVLLFVDDELAELAARTASAAAPRPNAAAPHRTKPKIPVSNYSALDRR